MSKNNIYLPHFHLCHYMAFFHQTARHDGSHDDSKSIGSYNIYNKLDHWDGSHDVSSNNSNGITV